MRKSPFLCSRVALAYSAPSGIWLSPFTLRGCVMFWTQTLLPLILYVIPHCFRGIDLTLLLNPNFPTLQPFSFSLARLLMVSFVLSTISCLI